MPKSELHWPRKAPIMRDRTPIYSFVDPEIENEIDKRAWDTASPIWPPLFNTWSPE